MKMAKIYMYVYIETEKGVHSRSTRGGVSEIRYRQYPARVSSSSAGLLFLAAIADFPCNIQESLVRPFLLCSRELEKGSEERERERGRGGEGEMCRVGCSRFKGAADLWKVYIVGRKKGLN